jgi:hypothetical protein
MSGKLTSAVHATVTAATAGGFATVTSATGLYVGARAWLSNTAGSAQDLVEITSISGTTIGLRKIPALGSGPNYGRSDISAYNAGGFLDQEEQFVYNREDKPVV